MKLDRFSSEYPLDKAKLFTGLDLYFSLPQTSDIAEKLLFGSCTTKTWKGKLPRIFIFIFFLNHTTMYFRVPLSNFQFFREKFFFIKNENSFWFCVLLDDSFSWKWGRKKYSGLVKMFPFAQIVAISTIKNFWVFFYIYTKERAL